MAAGAEGHSAGKKGGGSASGTSARLLAYTRLYSGQLSQGDKVWVLDDEDAADASSIADARTSDGGGAADRRLRWRPATVGKLHRLRGHLGAINVGSAMAGDVVAIEGIAGSLGCRGVIWMGARAGDSDRSPPPSFKMLHPLRLVVEPVVQAAVRLIGADGESIHASPALQATLAAEIRLMTRVDPLAKAWKEATRSASGGGGGSSAPRAGGRWILAGAGELHLDVCARSLSAALPDGIEIQLDEPSTQYRETVAISRLEADAAASGAPALPLGEGVLE